jgi:hypothetical protein
MPTWLFYSFLAAWYLRMLKINYDLWNIFLYISPISY